MKELKLALVKVCNEYINKGEKPTGNLYGSKGIFVRSIFEKTSFINQERYIYNNYAVCTLVNVTKDFYPFQTIDTIYVQSDTDSYQIRPKLIYKDSKGMYYKPFGKVVRLSDEQTEEVLGFIKNNK